MKCRVDTLLDFIATANCYIYRTAYLDFENVQIKHFETRQLNWKYIGVFIRILIFNLMCFRIHAFLKYAWEDLNNSVIQFSFICLYIF